MLDPHSIYAALTGLFGAGAAWGHSRQRINHTEDRVVKVEETIKTLESDRPRLAVVEAKCDMILAKLDKLDERL